MALFKSDVSPASPIAEQPTIGLIGMGSMGRMYAKCLSEAGWKKIMVCDLPDKFEALQESYVGVSGIKVLRDGHLVSRTSDFIIYSVEAEFIDSVVAQYGPSTKYDAVVAGQTSVKAPEKAAFEKYLPEDVHIVSCHSLHGPTVSPLGQPLVLIKHRAPDWALTLVENILRSFGSRYVYLSYEDHDIVTANTQAVTHAAFLSMGTAWASAQSYPWEHGYYVGGIETVKVNIMLRIYSNQWHVYAGLAILNPSARLQIDQFSKSATEIFKLMLAGEAGEAALTERMHKARDAVFGGEEAGRQRRPIFLSEDILDRFSLAKTHSHGASDESLNSHISPPGPFRPSLFPHSPIAPNHMSLPGQSTRANTPKANSHLALLAMVDCWAHLSIQPLHHLDLAATPVFRMWIGVAEYLFRSPARLDSAIHAALYDPSHRSDDLEFVVAARGWSQCVSFGSFELYRGRFEETKAFFQPRFEEATKLGGAMIQAIMDDAKKQA